MKRILFLCGVLICGLELAQPTCFGQTKTPSLYPELVQREVDLMMSLFTITNAVFDAELCQALGARKDGFFSLDFAQITFVFYYPKQADVNLSACELGNPDGLRFKDGKVTRSASTNQIPISYIRLWSPSNTNVVAEMEALVSMTDGKNSEMKRHQRITRKFVYTDAWKSQD